MNNEYLSKFALLIRSRKFWAAIIGLVFVVIESFSPEFPISQDQLANLVYLLIAYILGVAIEDAGVRSRS
jgi:uncharacterized membrane protein